VRPFDRQRILLGVTGGIASYKAMPVRSTTQRADEMVDRIEVLLRGR
jgi:phosphopantothenoylcysteine synthetase/decarboxylase